MPESNVIQVSPLLYCPDAGAIAVRWIYDEWGARRDRSEIDFEQMAQRYENSESLPIMFIARSEGLPVGCVILAANDLSGKEHLSPWLCSLFVVPEHRNKGVGCKLVSYLEAHANRIGFSEIFLFTPDAQEWYLKQGYRIIENTKHEEKNVSVMSKSIAVCEK